MAQAADQVARIYAKMRELLETPHDGDIGRLPLGAAITQVSVPTPTLPPATHTAMYAIGHRELVLVDIGAWSRHVRDAVDELVCARGSGARVVAVLATHHHADHVGGMLPAAAHWGVPVIAHAATLARMATSGTPIVEVATGALPMVDAEWQVLHTPGHAAGHLCLDAPQLATTIVGDMVAGVGSILIDPSDGDMTAYLASLGALRQLGARRLLPAHGPVIEDGVAKLAAYIDHRLARHELVRGALAELARPDGVELAALLPRAYADTPPIIWPLAERALASHVQKLVKDGQAIEVATGRWKLAA